MNANNRFDHATNIAKASSYRGYRSAFWPPADSYTLFCLNLEDITPNLGNNFLSRLAALRAVIDTEWQRAKEQGVQARTRFHEPQQVADALRQVGRCLTGVADRRAILARAEAIEKGYDERTLAELATLEEEVAVVAGQIATWYGKETGGLPTAFACRRDHARQADVMRALGVLADVPPYIARLHADLCLGEPPTFVATQVFFMAGEANLHPKHIAYFVPEDEGVKQSSFKKTYYFTNTHAALIKNVSLPLAARFLGTGFSLDQADARFQAIPVLGMLAHDVGHFVQRPSTRYTALNAADRWASVVLQEVAADVFGFLILAEVWAERLGLDCAEVVVYYLAECLRYIDRGLGYFPDSDGMLLQLSYFVRVGALALEKGSKPCLTGRPDLVVEGLRSLARDLADALLTGNAESAVALYRAFDPAKIEHLWPLLEEMRRTGPKSIEYGQEHVRVPMMAAGTAGRMPKTHVQM